LLQANALSAALLLGEAAGPGPPLLVASATTTALRHLAESGPVVLAIDDAQWLDVASARALAFAIRRLDGLPIGAALTLRDGHDEPLSLEAEGPERTTVLRLGGLDVETISRIIRSRVAGEVPRRRLARIHDRAGGNPMFALQLAAAGADTGPLPASLEAMVERRLLAAPVLATPAIERVAVLGPTPASSIDQSVALDAAVAAGILAERDGIVRFSHPLLATVHTAESRRRGVGHCTRRPPPPQTRWRVEHTTWHSRRWRPRPAWPRSSMRLPGPLAPGARPSWPPSSPRTPAA
jgi:hypothetical protein